MSEKMSVPGVPDEKVSFGPNIGYALAPAFLAGYFGVFLGRATWALYPGDDDMAPALVRFATTAFLFPTSRIICYFIQSITGLSKYRMTGAWLSGGLVGILLGCDGDRGKKRPIFGFLIFGALAIFIEKFNPYL